MPGRSAPSCSVCSRCRLGPTTTRRQSVKRRRLPLAPGAFASGLLHYDLGAFNGAEINAEYTLDGETVLAAEDSGFFYAPQTDLGCLVYPDGPNDAGYYAASWSQTIGVFVHPLAKGEHTLGLVSEFNVPAWNFHLIYNNTWNISVEK